MPNHIKNRVVISGKKDSIARFKNENISKYADSEGDTREFSFRTIIPRPESLDIESSTRQEEAIKYLGLPEDQREKYRKKNWIRDDELEEFIKLGETAKRNLEEYGFTDWHGWNIHNWGTKWDCYDVDVECGETEVLLYFLTAWNTPEPIFAAIAAKYPDLAISVEYADEDLGNNCGILNYEDGKKQFEIVEGYSFACELWGYEPEDGEQWDEADEVE